MSNNNSNLKVNFIENGITVNSARMAIDNAKIIIIYKTELSIWNAYKFAGTLISLNKLDYYIQN